MKVICQILVCIGTAFLCSAPILASDSTVKRANKTSQQTEQNSSLDLSIPNNSPWTLSAPRSPNKTTTELLPQLLHSDEQPKDFELGARLIRRDWKEVNEEEGDWRSRVDGAEFELKFRN